MPRARPTSQWEKACSQKYASNRLATAIRRAPRSPRSPSPPDPARPAYQASPAATSSPPSWIALPWATERVSQGATRFLGVGMSILLCVPLNDRYTLPISALFFPKGFDVLRFQPRSTEARSRSVGGIRRGSFVDFLTNEELMASQDPGKPWVGEQGMRRRTGRVWTPGLENPAYRLPTGTTTF